MSRDAELFPTIGSAEMRQSIALGRMKRTRRLAWLKAQLSAAAQGPAQQGLRKPAGLPSPDRVSFSRQISPAAPSVADESGLCEVIAKPAGCVGVAGEPALCAPNGDACPSQADVGATGLSCSVGRATAGRDRRFLSESPAVHSQVRGVTPQPCVHQDNAGAPSLFLPLSTTSSAWSRDVRNDSGRHGSEASDPVNARTQRKSSSTGDRGESAAPF